MSVSLRLGDDNFNLMTTSASVGTGTRTKYKIKFDDLAIDAVYAEIQPAIKMEFDKKLSQGARARYPQQTSIIKSHTVTAGSTEFVWDNIISGRLPHCCIFAFVRQKSWQGGTGNPFYFPNLNVSEAWLSANQTEIPAQHYRPDFSSGGRTFIRDFGIFIDHLCVERSADTACLVSHEFWRDGMSKCV